jgi:8-oxo-dGTP pyrophosphatase MutT (NUDIX family)
VNRDELLRALSTYAPADVSEAESLDWMRRFLKAPVDPFARENPEGHVTASAIVARPDGSEFLLLYHRKLGRWLQPGGHAEYSDASAFDAALREACEETGISDFATPLERTILDVDVHAIPARGKDAAHHHFDVRFLLTTTSQVDRGAAEDSERPMKWRRYEDAAAAGADASLMRALEKARRALAPARSPA